ncbi:MAG: glycosyl hydrolase 115 family protein [Saprospiraceae bacterium]|nr:glycosyl hydrolase 115 family protein [Saprospiraceae bacterium]
MRRFHWSISLTFAFTLLLLPKMGEVQLQISSQVPEEKGYFTLVDTKQTTEILIDREDYQVVHEVADLLAADIARVTGRSPKVNSASKKSNSPVIIIGTIGKNRWIDQLIAEGKLEISSIKDEWERFAVQTLDNPFEGIKQALVIAGSDRRGAAYGVFTLSESIGVSPWYYWADVPVEKKKELYLPRIAYVSKPPSIKFRGIFLNDEDWGLQPWAAKQMDPSIKDIGPRTYEKVFELVLRLKGNMVAAAMHECTGAFFKYPENKVVADKFGIMMTSSHAEPLLYNNTTEWQQLVNGNWDYVENKDGVLDVLDKRVAEAAAYENVYTVGMRGIHDTGMRDVPEGFTKAGVLEEVIGEERNLLEKHIQKPATDIPQIFVPYKEVLDIYEGGMKLPEDITIVWPDDNYGYIKKLSNKIEQQRSGGTGVYYHISYLGWPNDYLWLNTTPPALMYAEMKKAYTLGADTYWLVNVGDIKPGEMGMQLFLDMAWDFEAFNFENINHYQINELASIFGEQYKENLAYIFDRYYYHGFTRKPEYMTWDWAWNSIFRHPKIKDTELSFVHYKEAETRLQEYSQIASMAEEILAELPSSLKASFFELVYYPVKGASLYNHKLLVAQKNRWYARQGRASANKLVEEVESYQDSLAEITARYNSLLNGKWQGMMTAPGFLPSPHLPPTEQIELTNSAEMGLFVEGQPGEVKQALELPAFNRDFNESHFFEVYNKSKQALEWKAKASDSWIKLDKQEGKTATQERIQVTIDWATFPSKSRAEGSIELSDRETTKRIIVKAKAPKKDRAKLYREYNGVISIVPSDFHRKKENGAIKFQTIPGLGYSNTSLQLGSAKYDAGEDSFVAYDFHVAKAGEITIHTYMLPLFAKDRKHGTAYRVQVDDLEANVQSNDVKEYSREWASNVIRNSAINRSTFKLYKPGKHTLKIYAVDPGMIIQKIIIDTGGLQQSYIGPKAMKIE